MIYIFLGAWILLLLIFTIPIFLGPPNKYYSKVKIVGSGIITPVAMASIANVRAIGWDERQDN